MKFMNSLHGKNPVSLLTFIPGIFWTVSLLTFIPGIFWTFHCLLLYPTYSEQFHCLLLYPTYSEQFHCLLLYPTYSELRGRKVRHVFNLSVHLEICNYPIMRFQVILSTIVDVCILLTILIHILFTGVSALCKPIFCSLPCLWY